MLLLAATDQMCAAVSAPGSRGAAAFLNGAVYSGGLDPLGGGAFLGFAVGVLTVAGALALALEMLVREAAVYVVVLMLPLAFAAFVWPARRIWAVRTVELLVALILSKFAIVAVLSLAGAAFGAAGGPGTVRMLTAMALVTLSAFAPWAILRLLPFTEIAHGAASEVHSTPPRLARSAMLAAGPLSNATRAIAGPDWAEVAPAAMVAEARAAGQSGSRQADSATAEGPFRGPPRSGSAETGTTARAPGTDSATTGGPPGGPPQSGSAKAAAAPVPGAPSGTVTVASTSGEAATVPTPGEAAIDPTDGAQRASRKERLPGFSEPWQADNWTWKPMHLGLGEDWPPKIGAPSPDDDARDGGDAASEPRDQREGGAT
jgi:hypothetical protein